MARILITGSSDGLGSLAARALVEKGHRVVLHARNDQRAKDASSACPGAEGVIVADLSRISEIKKMAKEANEIGKFDTVIHNAGLFRGGFKKTEDGFPSLFAVNTIAPYMLTCLMERPKRLVYISSMLHTGGDANLKDIDWKQRGESGWNDMQAYSDSKLHNIMLAFGMARKLSNVKSNSLDPGWVATKMGGAGASGDIQAAVDTYVMLAEGKTDASGKHFYMTKEKSPVPAAEDKSKQDDLLSMLKDITGCSLPSA
ncbi:hypothetical protein LTS18_003412 [Coniosporium uncinatum]|uniref:Uncharacterized protein n=1 Tax=Coniosporium uncinatum TaxID=93489 RepID=A0ACC3D722_9PEZI|nr:hypothetical protein LTS18_003412 [Coniosporium uncinatum]